MCRRHARGNRTFAFRRVATSASVVAGPYFRGMGRDKAPLTGYYTMHRMKT
jgi:hypothetical protein